MRDESLSDYDYALDDDEAVTGGAWKPAVGAVLSLCLLTGLIVWSYRLGVRDATEVPVIRAMVQELRIAPDDPGGLQVAHQEREVYALTGGSVREREEAVLAPPPEPLTAEDRPMGRLSAVPGMDSAIADAAAGDLAASAAEPAPAGPARASSIDDLVAAVVAPSSGGVLSPLPPVRRAAGAVAAPAVPAATPQTPASPFRPGTPAIQLGAYLTEEVARNQWQTLSARNGDLLAGRQPVVNVLVGPNRTLYGLRAAPFQTQAEAQGLCAALRARSEDCIVTELN